VKAYIEVSIDFGDVQEVKQALERILSDQVTGAGTFTVEVLEDNIGNATHMVVVSGVTRETVVLVRTEFSEIRVVADVYLMPVKEPDETATEASENNAAGVN